MIRNILKTAYRNILKTKVFSLINIVGLSIGLSASFVIGLMIYYDLTFDKFHPNGDRIYRVTTDFSSPDGNFYNRGVSVPLGRTLKEGMANVELTTTFFNLYLNKTEDAAGEQVFNSPEHMIYADKNYFQLFPYEWLAGSPDHILSNPNEVVLTKSRAGMYFPQASPSEILGKTLRYNDSVLVKVTGVVNDFKKRSDLIFQEFVSLKTAASLNMIEQVDNPVWNNTSSGSQVFVKLVSNDKKLYVQEQLDELAIEHEDKEMPAFGQKRRFHLQPLDDLHFNSNYHIFNNSDAAANKSVLISLAFIALFLLLLGCVNFINLNTANATKRAKEIGVRKTLGSSKRQLVLQFMAETFLLTLVAAAVSLVLATWLLKIFSDFIPQDLSFEVFANPTVIVLAIALLCIVVLLSGFYPALVLSHFKPISVLKNQVPLGNNKSSLRKYLTAFQFVIAQIFIIATILVGKQINYLMTKDMGFETKAIAYARTPWSETSMDKRIRFMEELKKLPQVSGTSLGGSPPASFNTFSSGTSYYDGETEKHTNLQLLFGDQNYLDFYNLKLLVGRKRLNDTIREYVINEAYMKFLGFQDPQEALGKILVVDDERNPIVGVMQDFHQRSLKSTIEPMALIGDWDQDEYSQFNTIHFALQSKNAKNWKETLDKIETIWKDIYPDNEMQLNFMDDTIAQFYEQERKTSILLKWAMGLSILISCLGLLGLVIHTTERRVKEIGIRKVLGASMSQLNFLLCKEFLVLVGIAFAIAAPIAWYGMRSWLEEFAYKTNLSGWVFIGSGMAMLLLALVIISLRTISAANANPVKSLRTE